VLRALAAEERGEGYKRSTAERLLRELVADAKLPMPAFNAQLLGSERDCVWREERVVVEVDGWEFHRNRRAFEQDRARDAALVAAGYVVIRVTWRQLTRQPLRVVVQISSTLGRRSRRAA
jgi:very-short-patch-repair endonuclease